MAENSGLDAWFIHEKLIINLLTESAIASLHRRLPSADHPFHATMRLDAFERAIAEYLASNDVPSLAIAHDRDQLQEGQLVWLDQDMAFKGAGKAWLAVRQGSDPAARASFTARLATNRDIKVTGMYSAARLTCSSAPSALSGTKSQFMLGYISRLSVNEIDVRPIVIARRWRAFDDRSESWLQTDPAHVWPSMIDQFESVDFRQRISKTELSRLRDIPEKEVKRIFADFLGEPEVPNDWGGEQFDLWVHSRITVDGRPLRTAIAFKGPAKFHPMRIADLGKNGDQIDRLAQTAADLIVVQHCHDISAPVVNMLKAYANNPRNPKRYMTINGYDTLRILRAAGVRI